MFITVSGNSYITAKYPLQWRHNGHDIVSNHQPHDCLFNRLFRCRSKKTSKLRVAGLCAVNSLVTGVFPAQRPVTRKMFPFDDVIMDWSNATMKITTPVNRCLCFFLVLDFIKPDLVLISLVSVHWDYAIHFIGYLLVKSCRCLWFSKGSDPRTRSLNRIKLRINDIRKGNF